MEESHKAIIQTQLLMWHLRMAGGSMSLRELSRRSHLPVSRVIRLLEDLKLVRGDPTIYDGVDIDMPEDPKDDDVVDLSGLTQNLELGTLVLSPEEFLALVHAIQEVEKVGMGLSLKGCLPLLERLARSPRSQVDLPMAVHTNPLPEDWIPVRDIAIPGRHVLEMEYWTASRDQVSRREVVPLTLQNENETWYLRAWCLTRKERRAFRLDRVIRHRDTQRVHPDSIPPDDTPPTGKTRHARVRFDPEVASWARERIPGATTLPDGSLEAEIPFSSEVLFASWILSLSGHAQVLDPPDLRRQIRHRIEEAFRRDTGAI